MTSSRTRTAWLVAGAAISGVAAAGGLALIAPLLPTEGSAGSPSTTHPTGTTTGAPATSDGVDSTIEPGESRGSGESSDPQTRITVDVPRSEQTPPDGLVPSAPSPAPSSPSSVIPQSISDPVVAATSYLVAAESVTAEDTAQRHHRASAYMAPRNPAVTTGVLITELPPDGYSRTIEVIAVAPHSRNDDLGRNAYWIGYQEYLSPTIPATSTSPDGEPRGTFIVVERQAAGDWLVLSQSADLDPTE